MVFLSKIKVIIQYRCNLQVDSSQYFSSPTDAHCFASLRCLAQWEETDVPIDEQKKRKKGHPFFSRTYVHKDPGLLEKATSELTLEEYTKLAAVMIEGHTKYEIEEYQEQLQLHSEQILARHAAKAAQNSGSSLL